MAKTSRNKRNAGKQAAPQPSPRHRVSRKNDNLIDYDDASDDGAAPAKRKKIGVRVDVEQMPEEEEEVLETITTEVKKMASVMEILDIRRATIDTELQKGFQKDLDTMFRGYEKTIVGFESSNAAVDKRSNELMRKLDSALSKDNEDIGIAAMLNKLEARTKEMTEQKIRAFLLTSTTAQEEVSSTVKSLLEHRTLGVETHKVDKKIKRRRFEIADVTENEFNGDKYAEALVGLFE